VARINSSSAVSETTLDHAQRHINASYEPSEGVPEHPKVAQERLGHSTITMDLYSHVSGTMQEHAAGGLDESFRLRAGLEARNQQFGSNWGSK